MNRRNALTFAAGLTVLGMPAVIAQVLSLNDAINKAGQQRMLSQRMSKAYLALGLSAGAEKAREVLDDSMAKFDRQLVELGAFAPRNDIKATYGQLALVWTQYKTELVGKLPSRDNVATLFELDTKVLELANIGVSQLEKLSGKQQGHLVNVAGRQRMLSQRAAKYYLAQAWKAPIAQADSELKKSRTEFSTALDTLDHAPEVTPAIRQELELARQQWVFFELALAYQGNPARANENVFLLSENVLSIMDKVTGMYARVG